MNQFVEYDFIESALKEVAVKRRDLKDTCRTMAMVESLIDDLPNDERQEIRRMQAYLLDKLSDYQPEPIKWPFDAVNSTWHSIHDLLGSARESGAESLVAMHLVRATLELRFPEVEVETELFSVADLQTSPGDFRIADTAFHVTVRPMADVYDKCRCNFERGLRAYLLVPDALVAGTKQNAELQAAGKITVHSIESFVSQNIDETSQFSTDGSRKEFRKLLELYNSRVNSVVTNKSMMIEIPKNL